MSKRGAVICNLASMPLAFFQKTIWVALMESELKLQIKLFRVKVS